MAFSYSEATGDGVTTVFPFAFSGSGSGYIRPEDIHVYIAGVETFAFTLSGANQIQMVAAPPAPLESVSNILIRRIVPKDVPYSDFTRGNNFGPTQLNNTALQQLYALHEFLDGFLPAGYYVKGVMDMKGNRVLNLGEPLSGSDAAPYSYIEELTAQVAALEAGLPTGALSSYTLLLKSADIITKGPWMDARGFSTLSEADAAAISAGRTLLISTQWDVVPSVLNSPIMMLDGGKLNNSAGVQLNSDFIGSRGCLIGAGFVAGLRAAHAGYYDLLGDSTVQTNRMSALAAQAQAGVPVYLPKGDYRTAAPWRFTAPVTLHGELGTRLSLSAVGDYVMQLDFSGAGSSYNYESNINDIVLDGRGFALDGLHLRAVIQGHFQNVRSTNVTRAGLYGAWMQLCNLITFTCSSNVEAFTTTPQFGILIAGDYGSSSANTFTNPIVEKVSVAGIRLIAAINNVFINGTSEGNPIGVHIGEAVAVGKVATGNTFTGMDLEENPDGDIIVETTGKWNTFTGLCASWMSGAIKILGGAFNTFLGGVVAGFVLDAASKHNNIDGVKLYPGLVPAECLIADTGYLNTNKGVVNCITDELIPDKARRRFQEVTVGVGASCTPNSGITTILGVNASGATLTINAPTLPVSGQSLEVTIYNISAGATAVTWNPIFKLQGWVNPAAGKYRSVSFMYSSSINAWHSTSMSQVDTSY